MGAAGAHEKDIAPLQKILLPIDLVGYLPREDINQLDKLVAVGRLGTGGAMFANINRFPRMDKFFSGIDFYGFRLPSFSLFYHLFSEKAKGYCKFFINDVK